LIRTCQRFNSQIVEGPQLNHEALLAAAHDHVALEDQEEGVGGDIPDVEDRVQFLLQILLILWVDVFLAVSLILIPTYLVPPLIRYCLL
jgi:hypothetical protein